MTQLKIQAATRLQAATGKNPYDLYQEDMDQKRFDKTTKDIDAAIDRIVQKLAKDIDKIVGKYVGIISADNTDKIKNEVAKRLKAQ